MRHRLPKDKKKSSVCWFFLGFESMLLFIGFFESILLFIGFLNLYYFLLVFYWFFILYLPGTGSPYSESLFTLRLRRLPPPPPPHPPPYRPAYCLEIAIGGPNRCPILR